MILENNIRKPLWHRRLRHFWLNIHLTIALVVGFLFVILGITGSFNIFYFELEELSLPKVHISANAQMVKLDDIVQTLKSNYPQKTDKWMLLLPSDGSDYIWAEYSKPPETADELYAPFYAIFQPYTGEIVDEHYWGKTLWTLVYEVHATLLMGKVGAEIGKLFNNIICFSGLFLFISTLTGLYLWWPHWAKIKQALTIKRRASVERLYFDLHKTVGFYSSLVLLILAFTGFSFNYADYLKPVIRCFSSIKADHLKDPDVKSVITENAQPISVSAALNIADTVFPDATLRGFVTPDGKEGVYAIHKMQAGEANHRWARSKVWIDQYSGKVLAIQDPKQFTAGETLLNILWPLHNGEAFGFVGRLLWCVTGLAPLVLYVTGIMRWLQKRRVKKHLALGSITLITK
ncbi:MAG: PepSY-associated TM helix domain-containing protein [Methylococcales bacterium]|nr:PepSY-associated TM helix domain-containing protein [Methylococcales bacterium]MDP3839479.1 PepSY-associated TM helix domain-containing protein [Methylococcales bacterium]